MIQDEEHEFLLNINDNEIIKKYNELIKLVDAGKINAAENKLHEALNPNDKNEFAMALLFYDYINKLDVNFVEQAGFSKDEIIDGVLAVSKIYGYEEYVKTYLMIN